MRFDWLGIMWERCVQRDRCASFLPRSCVQGWAFDCRSAACSATAAFRSCQCRLVCEVLLLSHATERFGPLQRPDLLLFACAKRSRQEKHTPVIRRAGSCPRGPRAAAFADGAAEQLAHPWAQTVRLAPRPQVAASRRMTGAPGGRTRLPGWLLRRSAAHRFSAGCMKHVGRTHPRSGFRRRP